MEEKFCKAVEAIYQQQMAFIQIKNNFTCPIKTLKGTRQGCPLSPLQFILIIEILFSVIREDDKIKGLQHKGYQYKLRAFAGDVDFTVEVPYHILLRRSMTLEY